MENHRELYRQVVECRASKMTLSKEAAIQLKKFRAAGLLSVGFLLPFSILYNTDTLAEAFCIAFIGLFSVWSLTSLLLYTVMKVRVYRLSRQINSLNKQITLPL